MTFKASLNITLRPSILDPQGSAVLNSLRSLHFPNVKSVRIGKFMEVVVEAANAAAAETSLIVWF